MSGIYLVSCLNKWFGFTYLSPEGDYRALEKVDMTMPEGQLDSLVGEGVCYGGLSLIPGNHVKVEGQNPLQRSLLTCMDMLWHTHAPLTGQLQTGSEHRETALYYCRAQTSTVSV